MTWVGVTQVHGHTLDLGRWVWPRAWGTLAVVAMVLSKADGIVATSIEADIEASEVKSVASLVCWAVFVDDAADRGAALDRVVGVACKQAWWALALRGVVVGHTHSVGSAASGVAHRHALAHIASSLALLSLQALGVRQAFIAGHWTAPAAVIGVSCEASVALALPAVVDSEAGGVEGTVDVLTDIHALEDAELVWPTCIRERALAVILAVGDVRFCRERKRVIFVTSVTYNFISIILLASSTITGQYLL